MFHSMRWTLEKIERKLKIVESKAYYQTQPLPPFRYRLIDNPGGVTALETWLQDVDQFQVINPGEYWGQWMSNFVLHTQVRVPESWCEDLPLALVLPLGEAGDFSHPEALVFLDGHPVAACDRHHQEVALPKAVYDGRVHALVLLGWTGLGGLATGEPNTKLFMRTCSLVQIHPVTREFLTLARVAHQTASCLDESHPARHALLNVLDEAFKALDTLHPLGEAFYDSLPQALEILKDGIRAAGYPLDVMIHAVGHAHLDVAWLWTLDQTRQKARRTFWNVIHLMEQYPEFHFSQSQPQLYEFVREEDPLLFERIRQQVAEGRWEPLGGMWLEADCNVSGAESLVRQLLLGRSYFRQHFTSDAESPVLWLPDSFGFPWTLPQLIHQAGLKYFVTTKLGWNQYNHLPYDTFLWQGLDGSRVLAHFITVVNEPAAPYATYNAMATPAEALAAWNRFQQKDLHRDLLMAYGFGDGGGGPTHEMVEAIRVMGGMPGLPRVKQSSVRDFFENLDKKVDKRRLPVWNGELYLEYHRGTYTTQAHIKRANRRCEFLLHDAEFLATLAAHLDRAYTYPHEAFSRAWRTLCLNQFHDILPGSSIAPVYDEARAQLETLQKDVLHIREAALLTIAHHLGGDVLVVNPTSFTRRDPVFLPGGAWYVEAPDGHPFVTQRVADGTLVDIGEVAPYSITPLYGHLQTMDESVERVTDPDSAPVLENAFLRVEFNAQGDIVRIVDKVAKRDVLSPGATGNQFQAFEDRPLDYDAWDVDIFYDDKMILAEPASSMRWLERGPLRWTLEVRRKILHSDIVQRISLYHHSPRLDFETLVDWRERHILLKVAFPVDVLAAQATYEIQWGHVQRPTHRNTSWDWARFEVCAHKWADLSEGGYGVSLLNDCKYGHDIHDNVLRLTLLRSPTLPDPMADWGEHRFTYSLFPHTGGWDERVQAEAYALNDPMIAWPIARASLPVGQSRGLSLVRSTVPNVIIETVKMAEDGQGMILRLYESRGIRGPVVLKFAFALRSVWRTNLLEENDSPVPVTGDEVALDLKPYQVVTLRVLADEDEAKPLRKQSSKGDFVDESVAIPDL